MRNKEEIGKWRSSKISWAQVAPRYMTVVAAQQQTGAQLTLEKPIQQNFYAFVSVGASLLAMVVNVNAGNLMPRVALEFFASKLAPTKVIYPI
ncbi:hypothetical protein [Pseudomonas fluorescens]|uniref:hypothetical protein n=1 Tax=Pseudomonas fluorescens TaxID=294 RepID=UPI00123F1C80|nr:hypothetical protein [Pseudomonas fluorescens]